MTIATKIHQGCPRSYSNEHAYGSPDANGMLSCVHCGHRTKMLGLIYRTNASGKKENVDYKAMYLTNLYEELAYAKRRGWSGEVLKINAELEKRKQDRKAHGGVEVLQSEWFVSPKTSKEMARDYEKYGENVQKPHAIRQKTIGGVDYEQVYHKPMQPGENWD